MLRELRIRNFAIISDLSLSLGPGLNVLTGETGAGKSILVGALGLALGERAYTEMIRTGQEEAAVEAFFETEGITSLEGLGVNSTDSVIIRRNVSRSGKSRAYINDSMVTLQALGALGSTLVDVHGQHEHQSLLVPENQMRLLDSIGGLGAERAEVGEIYNRVIELSRRLEGLRTGERERVRRLDLLRYQVGEIEAASPRPGEDAELEAEMGVLSNLTRLNELFESAYGLLYSDESSAMERLEGGRSGLEEMAEMDPEVSGVLKVLGEAVPLVEEAAILLREFRDRYNAEPGRLDEVQERLRLLDSLKKKYGDTVSDILAYLESAKEEARGLESSEETAGELEAELEEITGRLNKAAQALSAKRKKAARRLEKSIKEVLGELALKKADFTLDFKDAPPSASGVDSVEFLFSANKGEDPKPLRKVASGGELSRIMLAVKSVMRSADDIPVLIFDEVDAGIGGKTAQNVAGRLKALSAERQVLCITHLPQIASLADRHFLIEKAAYDEGGVEVSVRELQGEDREEEVARMLSGSVTETSLKHAREIIARR